MKKIFKIILIIIFLGLLSAFFYYRQPEEIKKEADIISSSTAETLILPEKKDTIKSLVIISTSTYGALMKEAGIEYKISTAIYEAAKSKYDLVKVREGHFLDLVFDKDAEKLKELRYKIDSEDELCVTNSASSTWIAEVKPIPYEVKIKTAGGTVKTSMYEAALENGLDERAIIALADAFQWTIDFAMDPRIDDTFKFIYEERYLDGKYVMPGKILAGRYVNDGKAYEIYYFEEDADNTGYFDSEGNSVQKMFLKAPVAFKYISSGYTTGPRYVGGKYQRYTSSHKGIDYAAAQGAPIRAVGAGTVISAGWNSQGYGNLTQIRHNGTYSTNYGHQSRIIVKRGQKVSQGQVIGYVGSTGFSTGPHVHFEMVKNGAKVNPLREILPPGKPIKSENKEKFIKEKGNLLELLNK